MPILRAVRLPPTIPTTRPVARSRLASALALVLWLSIPAAAAPLEVMVGATLFPPYIDRPASDAALRVELLELLNAQQQRYRFRVIENSPMRRFMEFDLGKYDLSCFDNPAWGWGDRPIEATRSYLDGGELYVALAQPGLDQRFFDKLADKRMIGVRGYHYGFAKYNADPDYLERNFHMVLAQDNDATLRLLQLGRGDVAVVTAAFLTEWLRKHPEHRKDLLISKKFDQVYEHRCIVRKGARPSAKELNELFDELERKGALADLWRKYRQPD